MEQSFVDAMVNGVPLAVLVFGIVAYLKTKMGVAGRALAVSSLIAGVLFGGAYMVYKTRPPIEPDWWLQYGYWFGVVVYGLGLGLLASGVYEGVKAGVASVMAKIGLSAEPPQERA